MNRRKNCFKCAIIGGKEMKEEKNKREYDIELIDYGCTEWRRQLNKTKRTAGKRWVVRI